MPSHLLGLDAGGTVVKAVLFDPDGRPVAAGSARRPAATPHPRWVERDMDQAWDAAAEAIRGCLAAAAASGVGAAEVAGVGIAGHNDGAYLVDADLRPVRPAILASDTRGEPLLDEWRASGRLASAVDLIGQEPYGGSPVTVLSWLARHEPDTLARTRWVLFCKDWLRLRLTGHVGTDRTEASASFTGVASAHSSYEDRVLELFALEFLADARPPLFGSAEVVGAVTAEAASATGLPGGTPVVCGAHDVDAAAVGLGAVVPGALSIAAGTFSTSAVVSLTPHVDPRWQTRAYLVPGQFLNMSTSPASASTLDWLVRTVMGESGVDGDLDEAVAPVLDDESELVFLPYLYGSGLLPHASGGFVGLRGWHGRAHLLRAVLEGVVANHRLHVAALASAFALGPVARATGGAMRSPVWRQLFADGLGRRIEVTDTDEAGARGAAVLAGIGLGTYADLADAVARTVRVVAVHEPRPDRFAATWSRYQATIAALQPLWTPDPPR